MPANLLQFVSILFFASVLTGSAKIYAQNGAESGSPGTPAPAKVAPVESNRGAATGTPSGGDISGQVRQVGGGVSAPVAIHTVNPQFSDEARQKKIGGIVIVSLVVDEQGVPQNVHVLRGVGMGLDEKAVEAAKQYKFKPAMDGDKPVAAAVNLRLNFQISKNNDAAEAAHAAEIAKQPTAPYESDPHFIAALAEAEKMSATGQLTFAIDAYKKANKIAGGRCAECLRLRITAEMKKGSYKDAAGTAAELATIAGTPVEKSNAEALRGQALYVQGGEKPKPAQLQATDEALKAAIADDPKNVTARYVEGMVLARMGQMDAARQQFEECLAGLSPNDPSYIRAKHFAANPAMSYAKMAPAFTVTALDGSKFTLDEMGGRVVLVDFWATWCGPCNEELPHMKKIAKEFAGQPLVIISVSWDSDSTKWKDFIAKNEMTWVQ